MESKSKYWWVSATCMWLIVAPYASGDLGLGMLSPQARAQAAESSGSGASNGTAGNLTGKELIKNICAERGNQELCIKVLSSEPSSDQATLQDLAMISLKVAASNARDILVDAKKMIDDPDLTPQMQQGVSDCKENLLDAEGQIQDTVASILNNDKLDAQKWLKAALAAIDTCDASIPGDDDILSRRSVVFRQLCNIAVAINKNMMGIKS